MYRHVFDKIGKSLNLKNWEEWYEIGHKEIVQHGGGVALGFYSGSIQALMSVYPEYNWQIWKFKHIPSTLWKSQKTQRQFFESLAKELNIKTPSDWYKIKKSEITNYGGSGLLALHNNSVSAALSTAFPETTFNPLSFKENRPLYFWKDEQNRIQFINFLAKELNIKSEEDWYRVSNKEFIKHGGEGLLKEFDNSILNILKSIFPRYDWKPWKFERIPNGFWEDKKNIKDFLDWAYRELGLKKLEDWYQVSSYQISTLGGSSLMAKYGGLLNVLSLLHPKIEWNATQFSLQGKGQHLLFNISRILFPKENIFFDFPHPSLMNPSTGLPLQLDIFIPSKLLAFEYQGQQHFDDKDKESRDVEKRKLCESANISLVEVPYWWDGAPESLVELIQKVRPDMKFEIASKQETIKFKPKQPKKFRLLVQKATNPV